MDWGDFASMKQSIIQIIDSHYDKKVLSEKASELYSSKIMSSNYLKVYSDLLEQ